MRCIDGLPRFVALAAACLLLAAFAFSGCSTEEDGDECDETKEELIEPLFRIYVAATEAGGAPYTGEMDCQTEKHYCSGTVKGVFTAQIESTVDGSWLPFTPSYKLENEKDFVLVLFSTPEYEISHAYYYEEVSNGMELDDYSMWVFEDTLYLELPL